MSKKAPYITDYEYQKALEIIQRYQKQCEPKTIQVSATYNSVRELKIKVPAEWDNDTILYEMKDLIFDDYQLIEDDYTTKELTRLIVGGHEVMINK